jgi:gliding motility-associated lipoprotein GldH
MIRSKDIKLNMRGGVRLAFLLFVWSIFISCDSDVAYSHFESTDSKGWDRQDEKLFKIVSSDTTEDGCCQGIYDVLLVVRHTDSYPYTKLNISLERASLSLGPLTDTITITLADAYGKWIGNGNYGIYEKTDTIYRNVKMDLGYQISVSHAMHEELLSGISDVGIVLKRK